MAIQEAVSNLNEALQCTFFEGDDGVNDASRKIIDEYAKMGDCWLIKVNRYSDKDKLMWKYEGDFVYNFGADYVVPVHDKDLEQLLIERDEAEYTGTAADSVRIDKIIDRVIEIGGSILIWS